MQQSVPNSTLSPATPIDSAAAPETPLFTASLVKGAEASWAEFHDRYRPRLLAYLSRVWHGEAASLDDLLQDTFVRAVRHMRVFPTEDALWSWLTVLARSAVADQGRRRSRWGRFLQRWRLEAELRAVPVAPHRFAARLDSALARLDDDARRLLEAKYYHRRSVRSLARELGTTEKAVEGRLSRARRTLAKLLDSSNSPIP